MCFTHIFLHTNLFVCFNVAGGWNGEIDKAHGSSCRLLIRCKTRAGCNTWDSCTTSYPGTKVDREESETSSKTGFKTFQGGCEAGGFCILEFGIHNALVKMTWINVACISIWNICIKNILTKWRKEANNMLSLFIMLIIWQVMDWLEKHGEQFLCKSIGVGRNMQKAYACQKSQDNFEKVVQVQ